MTYGLAPTRAQGPPITSGAWSGLAHQPPVAVNNCLLLTDATVMCQQLVTNNWYRLTPDNTGSYVNGTWTQLASMSSAYKPLYFASAVLPDGRVIVEGGEYDCTSGCNANWQTQGAIYNPATNSWTAVLPPAGWTSIGDAAGIVLADGTFMLSDCCSAKNALFNANTLTWTQTGNALSGKNDEAGWTLLPNGNVLTVDAFPTNSMNSEQYNPVTHLWSLAGTTPVSLVDNFTTSTFHSFETGASILRPDGTVFFVGSNPNKTSPGNGLSGSAHTAIYNTNTSSWSAGPDIPNHDAGNDAPVALLPNGNVLMQLAPPTTGSVFGSPSRFYEFDGTSIAQVLSPSTLCPGSCGFPSYVGGMLVLPTGQILLTEQSSLVNIYTPTGSPNAAWAPTIASVSGVLVPGQTYTISGTQFNGLSAGASYGDDLQAATNYPIVRIVNQGTGHVFYAKTHGHSTMGVATGTAAVSTSFDVPNGIELGASNIFVVANGIASAATAVTASAGAAPTVVTGAATGIALMGATLNGTANPNGVPTSAQFQYGKTIGYGMTTPVQSLGPDAFAAAIGGGTVAGLSCGTQYHFRATATNSAGTTNGLDQTFTTTACPPPTVTTGTASLIRAGGARLNGTVNPNGAPVTEYFQYGPTAGYGSTSLTGALGVGSSPVAVAGHVGALTCNTLFHFRVVADNGTGPTFGNDATFTTAACTPSWTRTLLWRNAATGDNIVWLTAKFDVPYWGFLPNLDLNWAPQGTGDINGDQQADIVWRNTATGEVKVWFLNGTSVGTTLALPTMADPNWEIKGMADFNGDGKSDLLWRNKATGDTIVWFLNGAGLAGWGSSVTVADTTWDVAGVADFNGDGEADVLWKNSVTGQLVVWLMNGTAVTTFGFLPTVADPAWKIAGLGDIDGDGQADIIWRNTTTGVDTAWFMSGVTMGGGGFLPQVADPTWTIAWVIDIDNDGAVDFVWRNTASGLDILWMMNGLTLQEPDFMLTVSDLNWQLFGK